MMPALKGGQFVVYYQPIVDYDSHCVIGAEALVRWNHTTKGTLLPSLFLPLFEHNGLITELDNFVWETVCAQIRKWIDVYGIDEVAPVSVNVSRIDAFREGLLERLTSLTKKYKIPPRLLRLEITESAYVDDAKRLIQITKDLSKAGFIIEMDDFGSGYSSLNALKDIDVDILKLDMHFLLGGEPERSGNILSSVVRMARWLNLPVIAEGVETKQQADYLSSIGCKLMQGFHFSKPLPSSGFETYMNASSVKTRIEESKGLSEEASRFWDASNQTALIFNSYVGGAIIVERDGDKLEMLRANEEFYNLIHIERREYQQFFLNVWMRVTAEAKADYVKMLDDALKGDPNASCEIQSYDTNGKMGEWTRNRARLLGKSGTSEIFYVLVENITAERKAKEELIRQSELMDRLYQGVPCGIVDYIVEGKKSTLMNFNDAAWKIFGYKDAASFKETWAKDAGKSMVYPDDMPFVQRKISEFIENGSEGSFETRVRKLDGGIVWVEMRTRSQADGKGRYILQNIYFDITERKNQELERYGTILFSLFDEVYLLDFAADEANVIRSAHKPQKVVFPVKNLSVSLKQWAEKEVDEEERPAFLAFFRDLAKSHAASGNSSMADLSVGVGPKKRIVQTSIFHVDESVCLLCCRDVTKERNEKEAEEQIAILKATLREEERYRIIVEQTGAAIIERNYQTGQFYHSGSYDNYALSEQDQSLILSNSGSLAMVYPDDIPLLNKFFKDSTSGMKNAEVVLRLKMKDGTFRYTRMRGTYITDAEGKPVRTIGTFTDVDEEMRAKESLRLANMRLSTIIANIPSGVGI